MNRLALIGILFWGLDVQAESRSIHYAANWDNTRQHALYFDSERVPPHTALLYVHGMQSHAEWLEASGVGQALADQGVAVLAYDRRGSGRSSTARGHADSAQQLVTDFWDAAMLLRHELRHDSRLSHPDAVQIHVMANCFGARIAVPYIAQALQQGVQPFASLALIAPSTHMRANTDYSLRQKLSVLTGSARSYMPTPLKDQWFTTSPQGLDWIQNDPRSLRQVSKGFLRATRSLTKSMEKHIYQLPMPLLVFTATQDAMVDSAAVRRELVEPYQAHKRLVEVEGEHSLEFGSEASRRILIEETLDWVQGDWMAAPTSP